MRSVKYMKTVVGSETESNASQNQACTSEVWVRVRTPPGRWPHRQHLALPTTRERHHVNATHTYVIIVPWIFIILNPEQRVCHEIIFVILFAPVFWNTDFSLLLCSSATVPKTTWRPDHVAAAIFSAVTRDFSVCLVCYQQISGK